MEECYLLLTDQVDLVNPEGHRVVPYVSKPLPLGGPPGQVTIQTQYFFNKDLEYLVSGDKGRRAAFSISKLKAAQYLDFRLEELVPSLWIESERNYDISAAYVRSHMRILSVVSLKTYERYGYTFSKEIVLRRADYNENKISEADNAQIIHVHVIINLKLGKHTSEADLKNLHLNDFEDLYLLHLQGQFNHLSSADKVHLFNAVNLDINDQKKMMRKTEVHKFSNGTLNRILDKLDHMVKDLKLFKYKPGMETRIWSEDDRSRIKEFMEVIERRLKIKRIFRSLESFVGGR
ncbi:hypothetical protein Tco_1304820 [Tanacetum coccineum]